MSHTVRRTLGALGLAGILFAGCGQAEESNLSSGGSDEPTVAAEETSSGEVDQADNEPDQADNEPVETDPAAPVAAGGVYDPDAKANLAGFVGIEPGNYRTGAFGTPMSFTVDEPLFVQMNHYGVFVLTDVASTGPDDRELFFMRFSEFVDPVAPNAPIENNPSWPNDDLLGWLENLHTGVIATDPVETTVNGMPAIRIDLELADDIECGWFPGFCVGFVENNFEGIKGLNKGASYRIWIIDQGDEDPLVMVSAISRDEDADWFPRADAVMQTLAFGDIGANPVQRLTAGPNSLNTLGGVEVSLPDNVAELTNGRPRLMRYWSGRGFAMIPITDRPANIYLSDRPHDFDGNPLTSIDEVVDELTAGDVNLTEVDAITIGGVPARVFDVTSTNVGAIQLRFSPLDTVNEIFGWDTPAAGRLWLIEHPDRGLMMISTHTYTEVDKVLPVVNTLAEALIESLVFTP